MNIYTATISEAPEIAAFVSALSVEHIASSLGDGGIDRLLGSMNFEKTKLRITDGWPHICASENRRLAGIVVVKPPTHLYHLFVRSDLHRKGVGKTLFSLADKWSVETNGKQITTVNSSLNAVQIYRCLGFETDGPVTENNGVRHQSMVRKTAG